MRLEKFLFCESVRQEASGQVTLVGLFPTDEIIVGDNPPPFVLPTLAFTAVLADMTGIGNLRVQCEVKFGDDVIQQTEPMSAVRPQPLLSHHAINVTFAPFTCPDVGEYVFKLRIDAGETTSFSRRLKLIRPPRFPSMRH